jgi:Glutathione S-transferase, N-terminal domain
MKLYVCWGTFPTLRPGGHPCANAYSALRDAGYEPEVEKTHGLGIGPSFLHVKTDGRKRVEEMTGKPTVPVLVTDSGETITESKRIVEWARANPAAAPASS